MQSINPQGRQTYNDISMQYFGSAIYAAVIANYNNQSITDVPSATINLPDIDNTADEKIIAKELNKLSNQIATL